METFVHKILKEIKLHISKRLKRMTNVKDGKKVTDTIIVHKFLFTKK